MCIKHGNLKTFNLFPFSKNKIGQNLTLKILPYVKFFEALFERTNRFKAFLILTLVIEYIEYVAVILFNDLYPKPSLIGKTLFVVFHVTFTMAIISYIKCCTKNAGTIPIHWAFYRGDVLKRQRYCKICNLWKPERTHHCSICNRCVLNMDHHCPWFENCIGFYNRRFFMLLLFYSILGLGMITIHRTFYLYNLLRNTPGDFFYYPFFFYSFWIRVIATILMSFFSILFLIALIQFSHFHIYLIAKNSTTIENLSSSLESNTPYNLGIFRNFQQVFGSQPWLWWIPLDTKFTTPLGDGVYWI